MCISSQYSHVHIEFCIYIILIYLLFFVCGLPLQYSTEMLGRATVVKNYVCCLVQWQWFMLLCSISAMEICITRLDRDCYNDSAEHTFANFSGDGKGEHVTGTLMMNLETVLFLWYCITYSSLCTVPVWRQTWELLHIFHFGLDDELMKYHFTVANWRNTFYLKT